MKWLFKYNGKSCAWYITATLLTTWPVILFVYVAIQIFLPGPSETSIARYGSLGNAILRSVFWAPFIETFLIITILHVSQMLLRAASTYIPRWRMFLEKHTNTIAALCCAIISVYLHSHSADWGVHGGLFFLVFSFLYFTLFEKSILSAILSIMVLHMIVNAMAVVLEVAGV